MSNNSVTRQQLCDLWEEMDGAKWLAEGPGNCLCPNQDRFPEISADAEPNHIVFFAQDIMLGKERWRYVSALRHVIVAPFKVTADDAFARFVSGDDA